MTDLKLIDELLCRLYWHKPSYLSLEKFVKSDSCVEKAINRLREAYWQNEMGDSGITVTWAKMFENEKLKISKLNVTEFCTCSQEIINKTPGMLSQMCFIDNDPNKGYYDECRLCHKEINLNIWKKANNIKVD